MNGSKTFVLAAGVWALASSVAFAADMPLLERAPVIEEFGGWYLRGDIGMTNQQTSGLYNVLMETARNYAVVKEPEFESSWLLGLGVGYQFNSWFRGDITGEYRGKSGLRAVDYYNNGGTDWGYDDYRAKKTEWLFLANAYVDLGTWYGFTPFVGAGLGFSVVNLTDYRDISYGNAGKFVLGGGGMAADNANVNFAWALHAGVGYHLTPAVELELAYRYVYFGDVKTKDVTDLLGRSTVYNPTTFYDVDSHDVKFAVRWLLGANEAPPVVRKY
jgi:opacity protein-like surface antigen